MNIRLIASDIDGTILPKGGAISPLLKHAAALCAQRGIPFVIASGRHFFTASNVVRELGLTDGYMIIANGGAVFDIRTLKPVHEWTLSPNDARKAFEILRPYPIRINAFSKTGTYRLNGKERISEYPIEGFHLSENDMDAFLSEGLTDTYKLEAYSEDTALLASVRTKLEEAGYAVNSSFYNNLEIMMPGTGKGTAVRWLAEHTGVRIDECMAFGDYTNDLNMLGAVGWPVAVGNADASVKAAARIIAPDCADDGVAHTLLHTVLEVE